MPGDEYLVAPGGIRIAADRFYHRDHYWILPDSPQPGHCRIGLSAYACRPGIEVYFVEHLPSPGSQVRAGELLAVIETEKGVVSIHSPFDCQVLAVNRAVLEDPNCIGFDAYGVWILELRMPTAPQLLSPAEYLQYLRSLPPPQCFPAGKK
ncbi:Glycine cleavage system H protein [bacterium HR36]|nr:Glycine cleavage system H protein [bacterium HR36]